MPAEGGPARRMTWLGPDVMVRGWTPDGHILFVTTYGQPFFRNYRAFTLDPAGGMPQLLPLRPGQPPGVRPRQRAASSAATPPTRRAGSAIAAAPPATCGSTPRARGDVPPDDRARGQHHEPDVDRRAHLLPVRRRGRRQPLLVPARRQRTSAGTPTTTTTTRATRRPTASASSTSAAPSSGCSTRRRDRTRARRRSRSPSHRTQAARKFVPAAEHLGAVHVHPAGHSLAVDARGKLFTFALWEGAVRQHGAADGVRYRHGQWLADGTTLVARRATRRARSASSLFARRQARARCRGTSAASSRCAPRRAARASRIANHRNEVLIGDLDSRHADGRRPQRRRPHRGPRLVARRRVARLHVLDQRAPLRDQAARRRRRHAARSSRSPSSATTARRSIRTGATSTSCRCAPSTRCTTACSSS